jgi:Ca-activated chloride channel family protein
VARRQFREGGINRVILASDGVANVGLTDAQGILSRIRSDAESGIQLVTVGFGMGNFNDTLLEQLADKGEGFYAYVDDIDEARRLFVDNLTRTLHTVALDARVQVEFDPATVERYRLIGFENRAISDRNVRNDAVAAGAIGAGHAVTALYAIRLVGEGLEQGRVGTVSLRWIDPDSRQPAELHHDISVADFASSFRATAPTFQLDALVAATAERFRLSEYGSAYRLKDIVAEAEAVSSNLPQTDEVHGFLDLLGAAARLER